LVTESSEFSIKTRGVKGRNIEREGFEVPLEFKGLIGEHHQTWDRGPFSAPVQLWCKWSVPGIDLGQARRCKVSKTRWLRKFDTSGHPPVEVPLGLDEMPLDLPHGLGMPVRGCNVELTEVRLDDGRVWWTFSMEAYGDLGTVTKDVRSTLDILYKRGPSPDISSGSFFSYPMWLAQLHQ
jgi:hypothetical protein